MFEDLNNDEQGLWDDCYKRVVNAGGSLEDAEIFADAAIMTLRKIVAEEANPKQ